MAMVAGVDFGPVGDLGNDCRNRVRSLAPSKAAPTLPLDRLRGSR
jgi:hypothetical protein